VREASKVLSGLFELKCRLRIANPCIPVRFRTWPPTISLSTST